MSIYEIAPEPDGADSFVALLATAIADPGRSAIDADCVVASGPLGSEYKRCLVTNVEPNEDKTAIVTAVDEAPELFNSDGTINLN